MHWRLASLSVIVRETYGRLQTTIYTVKYAVITDALQPQRWFYRVLILRAIITCQEICLIQQSVAFSDLLDMTLKWASRLTM